MRVKHKKPNNKRCVCIKRQKTPLLIDYLCFTLILRIFDAQSKKINKGISWSKILMAQNFLFQMTSKNATIFSCLKAYLNTSLLVKIFLTRMSVDKYLALIIFMNLFFFRSCLGQLGVGNPPIIWITPNLHKSAFKNEKKINI